MSEDKSLFDIALDKIRNFATSHTPNAAQARRPDTLDLSPDMPDLDNESAEAWSWKPQPRQQLAMASTADEIYYGGARGGGKTQCQTYWVLRPCIEQFNGRYRYPTYRATVLRAVYDDLADWISTAKIIYKSFGGKSTGKPVVFEFPSGAEIRTGHMGDAAIDKRQGHNIHALAIDEVNQIENRQDYVKLQASVRVSPTGLAQTFCTGNPGGVGDHWVKSRFIDVTVNGVRIPQGTKFVDPATGMSRVFILSLLKDNPILLKKDPRYLLKLLDQDEVTRRQWLDGDWDVSPGAYFTEFRTYRSSYEPEHAYHCVHSTRVSIKRWYRKWISIDWGYNDFSAVYWYCQNDKGRVYVYREYMARKVGSFQLGVDIARQSLEDLPDSEELMMEAYVSPDLFKGDDQGATRASELARGISAVLGFGTAVALGFDNDEKELAERDPARAYERYVARTVSTLATAKIVLKMANNRRIEGLQFVREMLRWRPIDQMPELEKQYEILSKSTDRRANRAAKNYEIMAKSDSVLPKVRILSDKCPNLIKTIARCQTNPDKKEEMLEFVGDDPVDSFRYGMMGFRDMPAELPRQFVINQALDKAIEAQRAAGVQDRFGMRLRYIAAAKTYERERARKELEEAEDMKLDMEILEEVTQPNDPLESEDDISSRYGIIL